MKTLSKDQLQEVLEKHQLWLDGKEGGVRADLTDADLTEAVLRRADLTGADLTGAVLWGCAGEHDYIKSLFICDLWPITYTSDALQIGCKRFPISKWWEFDDETIAEMDRNALEFWREYKAFIRATIERFPARPTKTIEAAA